VDFARRSSIEQRMNEARSDMIAFSLCTARMPDAAASVATLRAEAGKHTPFLLAGGPHPSGDPEGTLALGFDAVIVGEGEESLPALLEALGNGGSLESVPGLVWNDGNRSRHNPRPRRVDLDRFPPFSARHRRYAPIEISRGCPHACRFCQTSSLMGGRMRHRGLDAVVAAIETGKACGLKHQRFVTPSALAYGSEDGRTQNLVAIEALLREASQVFGADSVFFGTFPSEVRPEMVNPAALELITRYTATERVVVGLQTGSDRLLEALHRGHTVADVVRAVELIAAAGLQPVVDLIFGLPGETEADRSETRALIERLLELGARLHGHTFMPLPGSPLAKAPPGRLDVQTRKLANLLACRGQLFGKWQTHERIASTGT